MNTHATTAWPTRTVAETARRNIFLANIINYVSSKTTPGMSVFYEALDDELVLDMPLPASSAVWNASTISEWARAIWFDMSFPSLHPTEEMSNMTLRTLLGSFTREHIRTAFLEGFGVDDFDAFRSLVILCAQEQFG